MRYIKSMQIQLRKNVLLKDYCTYRTGGPAKYFAEASNWQILLGLREFAKQQKVPFAILGSGSNVLFPDEGFPGLVIRNHMERVAFHDKGIVTAEGGVNLAKLILFAAEQNLGGLSALANIPGTVGGAVYGNAGTPELWIGQAMLQAIILPANNTQPVVVLPDYFQFSYRESKIKHTSDIILSVALKFNPMPKALVLKEVHDMAKERALKQPAGMSCGSFFKNPGAFPSAGWLIEQAGCKGMKVGEAQVSEKHANFILNTGSATSRDILDLAIKVHNMVQAKFNIFLEPEVRIFPNNPFTQCHSE